MTGSGNSGDTRRRSTRAAAENCRANISQAAKDIMTNANDETAKPVGIKEEDKVTQVQAVATVSGSSSGARRRARSTPLPPSAPKPAQTGRVPKHARDAAEELDEELAIADIMISNLKDRPFRRVEGLKDMVGIYYLAVRQQAC